MSSFQESQAAADNQSMSAAIIEVRSFVNNQLTEKEKNEAKAKAERWTRWAALSTALLALLAAQATSKAGAFSGRAAKDLSEATFNQTKASDEWSFYQAKAQKQSLVEMEIRLLKDAQPAELAALTAKSARYEKEKAEIKVEAEKFEKVRDELRADAERSTNLSGKFNQAVQSFQLALAVAGICLLTKKRWLWVLNLAVGVYGSYLLILALMTQ